MHISHINKHQKWKSPKYSVSQWGAHNICQIAVVSLFNNYLVHTNATSQWARVQHAELTHWLTDWLTDGLTDWQQLKETFKSNSNADNANPINEDIMQTHSTNTMWVLVATATTTTIDMWH